MSIPKLLIIYPNQFGYHTDSYKYSQYLADKFEITYICFDQGYDKIHIPLVDVIYCDYNTGKIHRLVSFLRTISSVSRLKKFNVSFTVQFKYSFIAGLLMRVPYKILDYRTGNLSMNRIKRTIFNMFIRFDSYFFDKITVISEGLGKTLWLDPEKITILPLGADVISDKRHSYRRIDLLYVGIIHIRNIYQTVEGLGIFLESNPELRAEVSYTIIGFGPDHDLGKIEKAVEAWNLKGIVHFLGRKKYTELNEYFDRCNVGVSYIPIVPYYQHQPATKTFEYVLSGLYTIATDTLENRRVITETNGILCKDDPGGFAEALNKLYQERDLINEEAVRNSLTDYLWENIIYKILLPILEGGRAANKI